MRFLALPFQMMKAAQGYYAIVDQSSIRCEDHIGGTRLRFDKQYVGNLPQGAMQQGPLFRGALAR